MKERFIMDSNQEKCNCEKNEYVPESDESTSDSPSPSKEKRKISLTSLGFNLKRGHSLHFKSKRNKISNESSSNSIGATSNGSTNTKKSPKWGLRFNCIKKEPKVVAAAEPQNCCKCTCYRRTEEHHLGAGIVFDSSDALVQNEASKPLSESLGTVHKPQGDIPDYFSEAVRVETVENVQANRGLYGSSNNNIASDNLTEITWSRSIHEDCDETARRQRAREIEQGVEVPLNIRTIRRVQVLCNDENEPRRLELVCPFITNVDTIRALFQTHVTLRFSPIDSITGCHTQVDFVHCLVPDLLDITNCSFYWGKMDRYEAERLLDGKPEGTFLLRDSAQEEFLFSVSFRKYGRSLHARIEQWNHKFSFDSHDPGVYTSDTVCGLIEHYKDPTSCMFFEPMLTCPLHRNFTFSLQHLCRATIVNRLTYDAVNQLQLPKVLKSYLKEYHYSQKVRVERFDDDLQWLDLRNSAT